MKYARVAAPLTAGLLLCVTAFAQESTIRKKLAERLPELSKIDEVSKSPIPGLYEVRIGNEIVYTDEQGSYLIQGNIIDTRTRTDLRITGTPTLLFEDGSRVPGAVPADQLERRLAAASAKS